MQTPTHDDVASALLKRITEYDIPPGSRLREAVLAEEYGVSRARIRDVLSTLEARGLVQRIPNRGAVVIRLEAKQVLELYDVRESLEPLAARIATQKQSGSSWTDLHGLFNDELAEAISRFEFEGYIHAISTFQRRIIDASEHQLIASILEGLYDRTRMLTRRICVLPGRAEQGFQDYRLTIAAMQRGDGDEVERLQKKNVRESRDCFIRFMSFLT